MKLRAAAGAVITTYVYINDDDKETSLLGKGDAQRLGIIRINLAGEKDEVTEKGEAVSNKCRRLSLVKKSELKKDRTPVNEQEVDAAMGKIKKEFSDVFGGIGKYRGDPVKIQMAENVKPVIQAPRRIPLHYLDPLKQHLEELVANDVIEGPLKVEVEGTWILDI